MKDVQFNCGLMVWWLWLELWQHIGILVRRFDGSNGQRQCKKAIDKGGKNCSEHRHKLFPIPPLPIAQNSTSRILLSFVSLARSLSPEFGRAVKVLLLCIVFLSFQNVFLLCSNGVGSNGGGAGSN
ncbi:hypothetical protein RJT34_31114 [Clitoria ternatea]|uniref:Uncharacterized protein n=1 Tax=Clitoria ternatea TaxID=43366 RepID=A0AAN9F1I0_CLITE